MMKKLLSLFLAAVLLISLLPSVLPRAGAEPAPTARTAEAEKEKTREEEGLQIQKEERQRGAGREIPEGERAAYRDSPEISLDQPMTVEVPEEGKALVRFTPTKTGWYQLSSTGDLDPWCEVYDEDGEYVAYNDDYGDSYNFRVKARLTAGRCYYFSIGLYGGSGSNSVTILLEEYAPVTSGECGIDLTWRFDENSGRLTIAGSGPMYDWDWNTTPWAELTGEILSVSLPEGLTVIGDCAFFDCNRLESVELPSSLRSIEDNGFTRCDSLTQLTIPAKLQSIVWTAFSYCGLTRLDVAEDNPVFSSRDGVLFSKDGTTLVRYPSGRTGAYTIPSGVTEIGEGAFYSCQYMTDVAIPDGVTTIDDNAFENCGSLAELFLPDSVAEMGQLVFANCVGLESVRISQGLKTVPYGCFWDCHNLVEVELPDQLRSIGTEAFCNCRMGEVTIPASVTEIGYSAFASCWNLTSIVVLSRTCEIAEAYGSLGEQEVTTVYGCAGSTAEAYAEEYEYEFVAIDLCDYGVHNYRLDSERQHTDTAAGWKRWVCSDCGYSYRETIPAGHVYTCAGYDELWYGTMRCVYCDASYKGDASVELTLDTKQMVSLTEDAPNAWLRFTPERTGQYSFASFSNSDTYTELYNEYGDYLGNNDDGGNGNNFLLSATLEAGETYYFLACYLYMEAEGSFNVLLTEYNPVYSGTCGPDLTWRFDPDTGALTIEGSGWMDDFDWNNAPWGNYRDDIASVLLPEGLRSVGSYAFNACWNLEKVLLPANVLYIGYYAFAGCERLTKITLPQSLKILDRGAFEYCTNLATVNIQKNLKEIRGYAFFDCPRLEQVTVPASVEEIGEYAFGYHEDYNEEEDYWTTMKVADFTIRGYLGSAAEEYAEENEFIFIPLQELADVNPSKWYYDAVLWALGHDPQITSGTDETHFSPNATCTRSQVMTFIWHAEGDPAPDSEENPFTDVKPGRWYTTAVLWAYHHDPQVTSGASENTFDVGGPCTRAQVVTFLWNVAGKPEPQTTESPFTDVTPSKWYCKAVLWAVENGITSGIGDGLFGPNQTCTRAQIVTFLFKADQIK